MLGRRLFSTTLVLLVVVAGGCGSGTPDPSPSDSSPDPSGWGSYPADSSLDERGAVEAYVEALDDRNGEAFCAVVAPWVSGRFDIALSDPDAPVSKPLRCPEFVSGFIGYIEDCCPPKFLGVELIDVGELEQRGDVVGVPITVRLRLEESGREYEEPLEDTVWLTRDADAWRVAKLSRVAAAASLMGSDREEIDQLTAPPDVAEERSMYSREVAEAIGRRQEHEGAFSQPVSSASCSGAKRYEDTTNDVVDYRHPAPSSPTPQLPAADIGAVEVEASDGRVCVVFEMSGAIQGGTTFTVSHETAGFDWSQSGFAQFFEVELRTDGRARVTSGRDLSQRTLSVPATVGRDGARLMLVVDQASFAAGRPAPMSREQKGRPLARFQFLASVTVEVDEQRSLHDDLGPPDPPGGIERFSYP
jgi:hypothetical protein